MLVALALAVVIVVALQARRAVNSVALSRFRALFPAWRFFDRATASPALLVRFASGDGELGAWAAIDRAPHHRALGWLIAPERNLALAYQAAVEQLVTELGELETTDGDAADDAIDTDPAVVGLVSYELVTRIARAHVPARARFQWKVIVPGEPTPHDYLQSPVIAA
ncbi:MAG: hypothetical protein K8W52_10320 [Deltaproteobacteria bacterium]|nr:hypothetical protein [Deltaproteobacteria bacterium]